MTTPPAPAAKPPATAVTAAATVAGQVTAIRQGWVVPAVVVRVIDGDTIVADLDLGWGVTYRGAHIRIAEINAPEKDTPAGVKAKARTTALLPPGVPIQVLSHQRDKYGRVLATVIWQQTTAGQTTRHNLAQTLLDEGLAQSFMVQAPEASDDDVTDT